MCVAAEHLEVRAVLAEDPIVGAQNRINAVLEAQDNAFQGAFTLHTQETFDKASLVDGPARLLAMQLPAQGGGTPTSLATNLLGQPNFGEFAIPLGTAILGKSFGGITLAAKLPPAALGSLPGGAMAMQWGTTTFLVTPVGFGYYDAITGNQGASLYYMRVSDELDPVTQEMVTIVTNLSGSWSKTDGVETLGSLNFGRYVEAMDNSYGSRLVVSMLKPNEFDVYKSFHDGPLSASGNAKILDGRVETLMGDGRISLRPANGSIGTSLDLAAHYYWSRPQGFMSQRAEADFRHKLATGEELLIGGSYYGDTTKEVIGSRVAVIFSDVNYVGAAYGVSKMRDNSAPDHHIGVVKLGLTTAAGKQLHGSLTVRTDASLEGVPQLLDIPVEQEAGWWTGLDLSISTEGGGSQALFTRGIGY